MSTIYIWIRSQNVQCTYSQQSWCHSLEGKTLNRSSGLTFIKNEIKPHEQDKSSDIEQHSMFNFLNNKEGLYYIRVRIISSNVQVKTNWKLCENEIELLHIDK